MKRFFLKIITLLILTIGVSFASQAQFTIKIRPNAPVMRVRPARPSPRHVWVDGEWAWRNGTYAYTEGYWAEPRPGYRRWAPGHWANRRGGYVWIPGHWR